MSNHRIKSSKNVTPEEIRERTSLVINLRMDGEVKDFIADEMEGNAFIHSPTDYIRGLVKCARILRENGLPLQAILKDIKLYAGVAQVADQRTDQI